MEIYGYTELQATSNFSFLRGASHPEELVGQAAEFGYKEIAVTDRNSLAGIVRAHVEARAKGMRLIPACRLDLLDGASLLAYPTSQEAYGNLSALLTKGNLRAEKGECHLYRRDVYEHAAGMKFIVVAPAILDKAFEFDTAFKNGLREYRDIFGEALYLAATRYYHGDDAKRLHRLDQLSKNLKIPLAATNDVHYHIPARRQLQDVLTCIREKCTIHTAGFRLHANAERYLKPQAEMNRLFRRYPEALLHTQEIAAACRFSLDSLKYVYPKEITSEGRTPQEELTRLAWEGARRHYGERIPEKISASICHEL
ncbi:MAG: PHP domain-containing protein, partial [Chitinophagaceae bacterium]|nr:PHP domain-containing protein [Chitinophagaceae bacterium]